MLYERWCKVALEKRNELALRDVASNRRWTFGELWASGEIFTSYPDAIAFPQGHTPEFILSVIAAWRCGKIICPLDADQSPPLISALPDSGVPIVHFKSTSATTGTSRLIAFTAPQLMADVGNIVATMGLRPDWPNLGVISMAHSYGFSNLVLPLLIHGIPLILVPVPLPEAIRSAMESESAVTIAGVPAMWRAWHQTNAISSKVRLAISAGAPLPIKIEQSVFQTTGVKIHNFYGSSECGGIAYDANSEPRIHETCVGTPMKNVDLSIADNGCLVVRSTAVGETYWPEEKDSLRKGTFKTTDLAELKNSRVFLQGRLSDQINVAGRKVSPETIEQALRTHPQMQDCLVFGVPSADQERTETIVAIIVSDASEMELKQFLLQKLPAWQLPREWRFVESLSTTARGKISRDQWRKQWIARLAI